ncbi:hypothetical protein BJX76DRAFT_259744 [Aspergillus varians]
MELYHLPMPTRPFSPAVQTSPGNALPRGTSPDLYSVTPYMEDCLDRAEARRCFIANESQSQVTWTDVDAGDQVTVRTLRSLAELRGYRSLHSLGENALRIISINQNHSWKPLNATRNMFEEVVDIVGASSDLLQLPLSFFRKANAVEESFSSAPIFRVNADSLEIIYMAKYAFHKLSEDEGKDPWVLRHTGVYQKYDFTTKNSTWVFLHPTAECQFQRRLMRFLQSPNQRACLHRNPLIIHSILFGTVLPVWRDYLKSLEERVLRIANMAVAAEMDTESHLDHASLSTVRTALSNVRTTGNRCLVLQPIFWSLDKSFDVLHQANAALSVASITPQYESQAMRQLLHNSSASMKSYRQAASSLQDRASRCAEYITDTLSYKDATVAKRQAEFMLRDSTSVRVITFVTLIYLPSTFTATLLGMNSFFEMDDNRRVIVAPQFWIYMACSIPLTVATLGYWWYFQKGKQRAKKSTDALMV